MLSHPPLDLCCRRPSDPGLREPHAHSHKRIWRPWLLWASSHSCSRMVQMPSSDDESAVSIPWSSRFRHAPMADRHPLRAVDNRLPGWRDFLPQTSRHFSFPVVARQPCRSPIIKNTFYRIEIINVQYSLHNILETSAINVTPSISLSLKTAQLLRFWRFAERDQLPCVRLGEFPSAEAPDDHFFCSEVVGVCPGATSEAHAGGCGTRPADS